MATLEKIRSKSVFLFIIIIVALLAFILGDFLTSGRTYVGSGTTMYTAQGKKVDYTDYQNAISSMQTQGQDGAEMEQLLLQQLLMQELMENEYKKMGINITDAEISRLMNNQMPISQQLGQMAQQLGLPSIDRATVLDAINNPSRYNLPAEYQQALKQTWMAEEAQLEQQIKAQVYMGLLQGLFTANELDAKAIYGDNTLSLPLSYVTATYLSVPEEGLEPTDAEMKAKWEELKPMFATQVYVPSRDYAAYAGRNAALRPVAINEPVRAIDYVVVNIRPSQADLAAAQAEVNEAAVALAENEALQGLLGHSKFISNTNNVAVNRISSSQFRELADSDLVVGKVKELRFNPNTNTYSLAKVLNRTNEVDSINFSAYAVASQAEADSLLAMIAGGTTLETIVAASPERGVSGQWASLVGTPANIKERMLSEAPNQAFLIADSLQGAYTIYQINERKAAQPYAEIAMVTYTVDPSAQTVSDLKMQLNSFLASNATGDAFSANADSLYMLQHGYVTASSAHIGNIADTRKAVKWAMNAKPGQVSRVFETPSEYLVIAVKEAYNDGYVPYTSSDVNDYVRNEVLREKRAAKLMEQYAGKATDLEGYAQLMNAEVRVDSTAMFNSPRIAGRMGETYVLQGAMAAAQPGQVYGPMRSGNDVVVFAVGEPETSARPYDYASDGRTFVNNFGLTFDFSGRKAIDPVMFRLLVGDNKVNNKSLNFVQDAE